MGVRIPPLALLGALERDEQVFLGSALAHAHVVAVVFLLVDERIRGGSGTELVLADPDGQ